MRNIRLRLAYDGTNYVGWQEQPNGPSIQAAVEQAIEQLTGQITRIVSAGRTDAGVHAIGQVANFQTISNIPCSNIQSGLQHFLPEDIAVVEATEVDEDFHATYSATSKWYRYVIHNADSPNPFIRRFAWQYASALDVVAMHQAAQLLVGTHDFRAFETQFPNRASSVRTIERLTVGRHADWTTWSLSPAPPVSEVEEGPFVWIDVIADGFLYNMVRAITGTLLQVGRGRWTNEDVLRILDEGNRSDAGETAPACGLYMVEVNYDPVPASSGSGRAGNRD